MSKKESNGPPPLSREERPASPPGPPEGGHIEHMLGPIGDGDSKEKMIPISEEDKWEHEIATLPSSIECANAIKDLVECGVINEQEARERKDHLRVLMGLEPRSGYVERPTLSQIELCLADMLAESGCCDPLNAFSAHRSIALMRDTNGQFGIVEFAQRIEELDAFHIFMDKQFDVANWNWHKHIEESKRHANK